MRAFVKAVLRPDIAIRFGHWPRPVGGRQHFAPPVGYAHDPRWMAQARRRVIRVSWTRASAWSTAIGSASARDSGRSF